VAPTSIAEDDMRDLKTDLDAGALGTRMYDFVVELFPLCRSITGDGIRETFRRIGERIPLDVHEVPTGTQVLDWTVPKEWNIREAYVEDPSGKRVVDFRDHNLHVVGYSTAVEARMSLPALKEHVHTLPDRPDVIPYRTSYYAEGWGFCMEDRRLTRLDEGEYKVRIDASLEPGTLSYAECLLAGERDEEILISCHCCHPSLANDNLSGIALATQLAEHLQGRPLRYSYRFLFIPGTIGSITWLARNEERVERIKAGLVVACVGDPGHPTYKRSRRGDTAIDRAAVHVLKHGEQPHRIVDFSPYGYDERQYCSPGFDLAVGSLTRTPHNEYPEYHTSADDLELVRPECLADSFDLYLGVLDVLEHDERYINLVPKGEPQLGRRGLYPPIGARGVGTELMARLWVLNLSDGEHSLLDVAERSGLPFPAIKDAARVLSEHGLLARAADTGIDP
jgi:aminopeptidase-like protein